MDIAEVFGVVTTLPDNPVFDAMRVLTAIWSGMLLIPMIIVGYRTQNYGFYALAIFMFLSALNSLDQLGDPFVVYLTPLRLVGVSIATYWMWTRRNSYIQ